MLIKFSGDDWLKLSTRVDKLTRDGLLTWEEDQTAPEPMAFKASTPNGSRYYLYPEDFDGRFPYIFAVWRRDEKLGQFTTTGFNTDGPFDNPEEEASAILGNLYTAIVRRLSGADETIDSLLAELDLLDPDADSAF